MGVSSLLRSSFGLALFVVTCAVLVRAVVGGHKEKSVAIGGGAGRHDRRHDHPVQEHMCGSVNPSREEEEQDLEQMKEWKRHFTSHPSTRRRLQEYGSVEINLHYHVFRRADNSEDISDEVLMEQFRVLNDSFANTPFKFVLQPINRYDNDEWADYDFRSQAESNNFAITKDLRIGGPDALNIYFNQGICETVAGFASFPLNDGYYPNGSYSPHDGIWMCSMTLPGSYMSPEGKILVHEREFSCGRAFRYAIFFHLTEISL